MTRQSMKFCVVSIFLCCASPLAVADGHTPVSAALQALESVRALSEVTISPDAEHVVYGSVVTGTRGGSAVLERVVGWFNSYLKPGA
jgi:hypothetical protein